MIQSLYYRVPFSETDAMGIVHHCNHGLYFERGRVEFLRMIDMPYAQIVARGLHFPVLALNTEYKKPLRFDEILAIETRIQSLSRVRLNFEYRIHVVDHLQNSDWRDKHREGKAAAIAISQHCCTNEAGRPVEIPSDVLERMQKYYSGDNL